MKRFGGTTGVAVLTGVGLLLVGCGSQGAIRAADPTGGPVSTTAGTKTAAGKPETSTGPATSTSPATSTNPATSTSPATSTKPALSTRSEPSTKPVQVAAPPVTYLVRNFERMNNGRYVSHAEIPNGWREVRIAEHQTRFLDTVSDRTMRFETWPGPHTPAELVATKVKQLKAAVPSLQDLESSTVTMTSEAGQSPMTVGEVTYTYQAGTSTPTSTRRVITYVVALNGKKYADAVITASAKPADGALLSDIVDSATKTLTITPLG